LVRKNKSTKSRTNFVNVSSLRRLHDARSVGGGHKSFVWLRWLSFVVHPASPADPWQQRIARARTLSCGAYELCRGIHSCNPPPARFSRRRCRCPVVVPQWRLGGLLPRLRHYYYYYIHRGCFFQSNINCNILNFSCLTRISMFENLKQFVFKKKIIIIYYVCMYICENNVVYRSRNYKKI